MEQNTINFFFEDISEPVLDYKKIKHWLSLLIDNHKYNLAELNYILCSDEYLLKINKEYLDHDYYTDIITFDNSEEEASIEGDVFVSIDRVNDNSTNLNTTKTDETLRVVAHGVLHLCGFKDKTEEEASEMRKQEDIAIELYHKQ
ncbi:rRNA maturation RNase YbeY [Cyclobacteriaceae bacterium]|nr:rRNA maturation RNase YbeY [Cyclobacteriaceae bacterium]